MISAKAVENALEKLTAGEAVEEAMMEFGTQQTAYLQYLLTDAFELLTEDERDYLRFLALVIYEAIVSEVHEVPSLTGTNIENWDERSWTWMQESVGKPMATRLDPFFDNIDQEELLAFAEDSLVDPDPEEGTGLFATGASRELAVVGLAVLIGAIDESLT